MKSSHGSLLHDAAQNTVRCAEAGLSHFVKATYPSEFHEFCAPMMRLRALTTASKQTEIPPT